MARATRRQTAIRRMRLAIVGGSAAATAVAGLGAIVPQAAHADSCQGVSPSGSQLPNTAVQIGNGYSTDSMFTGYFNAGENFSDQVQNLNGLGLSFQSIQNFHSGICFAVYGAVVGPAQNLFVNDSIFGQQPLSAGASYNVFSDAATYKWALHSECCSGK